MSNRDVIAHEIVYPHPPERVWRALTDPRELSSWLMVTDFEPRVGHQFRFKDPDPWPDGKYIDIECEVVECVPPHRLAYTWASPPKLGHTLVTWTLEAVPGGTRVRLVHSGFSAGGEAGAEARDLLDWGWGGLLREELFDHLDTGAPKQRDTSPGER